MCAIKSISSKIRRPNHSIITENNYTRTIYDILLIENKNDVKMQNINKIYTTARSRESANAFDDETSKFRPIAAETRSKGSSISLVGLGCRLHKNQNPTTRTASTHNLVTCKYFISFYHVQIFTASKQWYGVLGKEMIQSNVSFSRYSTHTKT